MYFLAILIVTCFGVSIEEIVLQIENGLIRGGEGQTAGTQQPFYSFRGIPFAEPPIGPLRFEPPVPKRNWIGILDATRIGPDCIQGDLIEGSEDCLTVNVFSPRKPGGGCQLLPTYVWIYGGAFIFGTGNDSHYGPDFILEKNIVVVTFNYRLGYLGFLSTGDEVAPGNAALKDQLLALKWVQRNIHFFCGDPNQVTLGGESAGAASVSYHLQSPLSQGLFHRAIMESGTSLSLWALTRNAPQIAKQIARAVGVSTSSSAKLLQGLKEVDIVELHKKANNAISLATIAGNPKDGLSIGPVIEPDIPGAFFTKKSHQALSNGDFSKIPILIGFNSLEGAFTLNKLFQLYVLFGFDLNLIKLLPADANISPLLKGRASWSIKKQYFGYSAISLSNDNLMIYLTDDQFVRPTREFVNLTRTRIPVYFYRFSYEGGLSGVNRTYEGVSHTEELSYYWKFPYPPTSPQDLVVRDRFTTLLTNFIHLGNPTPVASPILQNKIWPPSGNNLEYLDIGIDLVNAENPENGRMPFWDNFYATYGRPPYDTY